MTEQESEEEQNAREFRGQWQAENDLTAWLTEFRGDLVGDAGAVRGRLDDLLPVLRSFADRLAQIGDGVVLTVGRTSGFFTEERWRKGIDRWKSGSATFLGLDRNTFYNNEFGGAGHRGGVDKVLCWLWLGDSVMGTQMNFECDRGNDDPFTPTDFTNWMVRIAEASGMSQGSLHPGHTHSDGAGDPLYAVDWESMSEVFVNYNESSWRHFTRGAAWGLWLTAEHITGLGGLARVRSEAPVWRVEPRGDGVWLQLTEFPNPDFVEHMSALRAYLQPIVPTIDDLIAHGGQLENPAEPPETSEADHYVGFDGRAVKVIGWKNVREEMELTVVHAVELDNAQRSAIERCVVAWVESGTAGAFGKGSFHGWTSGEWDGGGYYVPVDSGAQEVNWKQAINDLARRLGGCANEWAIGALTLRLGASLEGSV